MAEAAAALEEREELTPEAGLILGALPDPVLAVDERGRVRYANPAAEQFFDASASALCASLIEDLVPFGSPLVALLRQVRERGSVVSEHGLELGGPRLGPRQVNLQVSPLAELSGWVLVTLRERTIADKMDRQLIHRGAARSLTGMAQMLAHEIKNPLSGIRGAAQLLEQDLSDADRELTRLIRDEVDRVCGLVDRMEAFADEPPLERRPVNIHEVLDRVRAVASNGFARAVRFEERYDPSLPPVMGSRDQLVQVFLNLVKNAAEAVPAAGGEIVLGTAFRPGVRLSVPGSRERLRLPLEVSVQDNGAGIAEDLRAHLFDPFVTSKSGGSGLGLALVAKVIGEHGGLIAFESEPRRTIFRVLLPVYREEGEG
jgi:two-component system nitrogen regulation sensor histidine kinase GlnL